MTAAIAPGTPSPAAPTAVEAPPPAADAPTAEGGDDGGDPVAAAREEARKLLFSDKSDEELEAEAKKSAKAKVEEPKPKVEEKPKDEVELSKKWAKLTAQEDRLVERQKKHLADVETKEKGFAEREARLAAKEAQHADPIKYLAEHGWTKDQISKWIMSDDGKIDPEVLFKQLETRNQQQIEELRREREREKAEFLQEQENRKRQRDMEQVETELNAEVKTLVDSDQELGVLKRLIAKKPNKFEGFVQRRVGEIIREVWKRTFDKETGKGTAVDPREALLYLQQELAELQLADPGQAPAVKPATPVAVEPTPITNGAQSQRVVRASVVDDGDVEALRAKALRIARGEEEPED